MSLHSSTLLSTTLPDLSALFDGPAHRDSSAQLLSRIRAAEGARDMLRAAQIGPHLAEKELSARIAYLRDRLMHPAQPAAQ
ncbi:hypothetical protein [Tropicibacter naphthalenivorans]|uniref:Uncharacterized protein n=1 Tax=Tropicibacter naphthalenivorans TaxID=441103 RepID=A0A0P1GCI6_9RHOB|nr:hypothetical protein [Tropicibacter naphthalenivorans]CUH79064.1 hypothetical protein TRN7648_02304 [Tropicibacter naphthalenivorans]SMD03681.1 hypothetical protein SAMN04488093_11170 [Tropicibacter naphthalenivorans]